jgi:hypothetical protein
MRKYAIAVLALIMLVPVAEARRKRPKAGRIVDGVYEDAKYGFKIPLDATWKASVMKAEDPFRLVMVQKNYLIPTDYSEAPDYTKVPRMVVYADTTSMSVYAFVDSLLSESYNSDQTKDIKKEFEILAESDLIPKGQRRLKIGEEKAVVWQAQAKYVKEVATSASARGGKRVYGSYGGGIVGIKKGDTIVLFHTMCEWDFFQDIFDMTMEKFIKGMTWVEDTE